MNDFIEQVKLFIETHHEWAGPVTALLTLGESLLVVGLFIPATALMVVMGTLIGSGMLDGWTIMIWGIAGAVVGDALSYWLGRWVGPGVMRRWPLNRQRRGVARARLFFYRYGFASVLLGRFMGPIRSTIPTIAGEMGKGQTRFQIANVLSALAWMPLMLAPGYLTARNMSNADGEPQWLVGLLSAVVIFAVVGVLMGFMRKRQSAPTKRKPRP